MLFTKGILNFEATSITCSSIALQSVISTHVWPIGMIFNVCSTRFLKDSRVSATSFIGAFAVTPGRGELAAALMSRTGLRAVPTSTKNDELAHLSCMALSTSQHQDYISRHERKYRYTNTPVSQLLAGGGDRPTQQHNHDSMIPCLTIVPGCRFSSLSALVVVETIGCGFPLV